MENVKRLSDIEAKPILRALTGFDDLDCLYGYSKFSDKPNGTIWGIPKGKISLWSGCSGIGKSRLSIEVAKNYAKFGPNFRVLYFQTEAPLSDFASWAKNTTNYTNIFCSGEDSIEEMIKIMYEVSPHIVFIDSVNEIVEFPTGRASEARRLIKGVFDDGNCVKPGLKQVCNDLGCHLILLGQVNQDGKTIKGGTSLPHLVDIALDVVPLTPKDPGCCFVVKVGAKHRFGSRDGSVMFIHYDWGIKCGSDNNLNNKVWCESHGIPYMTEKERSIAAYALEQLANTESVVVEEQGLFKRGFKYLFLRDD